MQSQGSLKERGDYLFDQLRYAHFLGVQQKASQEQILKERQDYKKLKFYEKFLVKYENGKYKDEKEQNDVNKMIS